MRILYHHRTRGKNVEGIHIREIVKALTKLGNEVFVISPPHTDPMNLENSKQNISKTWDWISKHFPQIGFEILELFYNLFGYSRLKKFLKENPVDAIYERYAFFTYAVAYLAKKKKLPYIVEVNEVSGVERVRKQIFITLSKRIEKKIFQRANAILVVSDFLKHHIIEQMNIDADKVYVFPNAVDPEKFSPDIDGKEVKKRFVIQDKLIVGFVGSFVNWSNLEFFIQVFSEISKEYKNVHLLMVGDGPLKDILLDIVGKENIEKYVTFTGNIPHTDVPKFVAAMDICVIPKSNQYRSPIKLFEYMAMAKPIVAPKLEPIQKIVKHGENAILFDQNDRDSLKDSILYLIDNETQRSKIGKLALKTVSENHTCIKNAEKILNIYKNIVSQKTNT